MNQELIEQIRGGIKGHIQQWQEWVRQEAESRNILNYIDQLPDLPEEMRFVGVDENTIKLRHPYNKLVRQQVHEYLISLGWKQIYELKEEDCLGWQNPYIVYENKFMRTSKKRERFLKLSIEYSDSLDGSTCTRKLLGERKIEKFEKIYEWVCPEGANE